MKNFFDEIEKDTPPLRADLPPVGHPAANESAERRQEYLRLVTLLSRAVARPALGEPWQYLTAPIDSAIPPQPLNAMGEWMGRSNEMASAKKPAAAKGLAAKKPPAQRSKKSVTRGAESIHAGTNASTTVALSTLAEIFPETETRLSFLKGCICIAQANGSISDEEKAFFLNATMGMGLSTESQVEVVSWLEEKQEPNEVRFDTKRQALFFLREVLQICYLDSDFCDAERKVLDEMCRHLDISRASFEYIEDWVRDGMNWRQDGERLLELEE